MSLFATGEDAAAIIPIGASYLALMAFMYFFPGMTNGVQGFFRGIGRLKITLLGTCIQAGTRVVMTYVLAPTLGIAGIAYASMIGWVLMLLVQVPICLWELKQLRKNI